MTMIKTIISDLERHGGCGKDCCYQKEVDWLRSLERMVCPQTEWSDEDDVILDGVLTFIPDKEQKYWLKSLKDRYVSQPKQEWGEEDEESILEICNYLDRMVREDEGNQATQLCVQELKEWLKSLRPRPYWKPTKEQLEALDSVIYSYDGHCGTDPTYGIVVELYRQLKAL